MRLGRFTIDGLAMELFPELSRNFKPEGGEYKDFHIISRTPCDKPRYHLVLAEGSCFEESGSQAPLYNVDFHVTPKSRRITMQVLRVTRITFSTRKRILELLAS